MTEKWELHLGSMSKKSWILFLPLVSEHSPTRSLTFLQSSLVLNAIFLRNHFLDFVIRFRPSKPFQLPIKWPMRERMMIIRIWLLGACLIGLYIRLSYCNSPWCVWQLNCQKHALRILTRSLYVRHPNKLMNKKGNRKWQKSWNQIDMSDRWVWVDLSKG